MSPPTLPPKVLELLRKQAPLKLGSQSIMLLDSKNNLIEFDSARGMFLFDHNAEFKIVVGNFDKEYDIEYKITIDGKKVGIYPTSPNSGWILESPKDGGPKFRFAGDSECKIEIRRKLLVESEPELEVQWLGSIVGACIVKMGLRPAKVPLVGNNVKFRMDMSPPTLPPKVLELLLKQAPLKLGSQSMMLLDSKNNLIEFDSARGMFLLDHNAEFKIVIGNFHKKHGVSVTIIMNGMEVGTFSTSPTSVWILERPQDGDLKFRFVGDKSQCKIIVRRNIQVIVPDNSPHEHEVELFEERVIDVCTCIFQIGSRPKVVVPLVGTVDRRMISQKSPRTSCASAAYSTDDGPYYIGWARY